MSTLARLLRHDPPLSTGGTAVYPYQPDLERAYRFTSRFGDEVLLHAVDGDRIHLPRALCPVGLDDRRSLGEPVSFPRCPTMRPDQTSWFPETLAFLKAGQSGITVAGTGRGKTLCGYYCTHFIGRKTLVITTKDDIYQQWIDGASTFLGLPAAEIGEIRQDKCEVLGTKFVVAMIHSLSIAGKYPDWITKDFGLIIYDECQRLPADQFSAVASMFPARLRLGLSATPERSDGKELLVQAHIGPVRVKATTQMMVPKVLRYVTGWSCPRRLLTNPRTGEQKIERLPHEPGRTTHIEKIMARDQGRNALLGELVVTAFRRGRQTVVFSTLLEHLDAIAEAAKLQGLPKGVFGFYVGVTGKKALAEREAVKSKPVIFTTYGMMAEGTDIPWLDTCILAMPRSQVTQPIGRIRREYPNKREPVVIDLVDRDSPVFSGYANTRDDWYRRIGAVVKML